LPDGGLDFQGAASSEQGTLKLLKTAPDRVQKQDYQDPDSGEWATLELEAEGENDLALLQLAGSNLTPLGLSDSGTQTSEAETLFGFPFGLNQSGADPRAADVKITTENGAMTLDRSVNPGESGAPLLNAEGKVLAIASGANHCVPIQAARKLIP
jgi:S1-C subfamily serine protease